MRYLLGHKVSISVVSHGHGSMVWNLTSQLLKFPEIVKVILTINIPEDIPRFSDTRVHIIINSHPKGFGQNHNDAFLESNTDYFCVLNPDIEFIDNPFPMLIAALNNQSVGLVAPVVLSKNGSIEDSMRKFLTPWTLIKRIVGIDRGAYLYNQGNPSFYPDWVAGMFMLFKSKAYADVGGFDVRYFMYCEDADISTRLWGINYRVFGCLSAKVIHKAQRASRYRLAHLLWHVRSMVRYFLSHSLSLPRK